MCRLRRKGFPALRNAVSNADFANEFCHEEIYSVFFAGFRQSAGPCFSCGTGGPFGRRTEHDFGDVKLGETRKATFTLTSSADVVVILSASTNCECTKASWGRKPLHKGDKSTVEVSYEAREKGFFRKNITIRYTTGGAASTLRLTVTGNVP